MICIQELFLGNQNIAYAGFNLYWLSGIDDQKDIRVLIAVKKDILNKLIIENRTGLVRHLYCIILDMTKCNLGSRNI